MRPRTLVLIAIGSLAIALVILWPVVVGTWDSPPDASRGGNTTVGDNDIAIAYYGSLASPFVILSVVLLAKSLIRVREERRVGP